MVRVMESRYEWEPYMMLVPSAIRRTRPPPRLATTQLVIIACCCAIALILGLMIPWAEANHSLGYIVGGIGVVFIVGVLAFVPVRTLPAIALLVSLLIPAEAAFLPKLLEGAALGVVPLAIWMIRARGRLRAPRHLRCLAVLFGAWLIASEIFAPLRTKHGVEWFVVVEITLVLAIIKTPSGFGIRDVRSLFLRVTTVLGIYALVEGFILHFNPLFSSLFEHTNWWGNQRFNASYRVTTLLGHPLDNGLVFSAAAVLAASEVMERRDKMAMPLVRLAILVGAVAATHERGSVIGLAVGWMIVMLFTRAQRHSKARGQSVRRVVLLTGAVVGVAVLISGLQARSESSQGRASALVREAVVARTTEALHGIELFGAGPGEVDSYREIKHLGTSSVTLENSYAEIVVDIGPIGALIGVILLLAIVITGLRTPLMVGETAALAAILVDIGGYNAIQGQRPVLVIISLLIISIITGVDMTRKRSSVRPDASSVEARTITDVASAAS